MGKSISKAFKKVVGGALNTVGLGPSAPQPKAQDAQVAAAPVEVPQDQVTDVETDAPETNKKKVRATGKRGLQVSRTSGGGISI
ncbi:MAG: hypothetical protein [Enterobacter phage ENC31]|uniref:Virion assembly protein n=1 Tax=Enterobacter phage IME278 TaxID=2829366 RepID=A0A8T8JEH1_9CAUD|nr:virion assembly protein [Enterobacter phage IME278]UIW11685.1 MAG: hypothetical protein [Enterobacter phage ENC31]UIW12498.1 MAG: hypothetical protein [Enterobacter phage ENC2-2_a]